MFGLIRTGIDRRYVEPSYVHQSASFTAMTRCAERGKTGIGRSDKLGIHIFLHEGRETIALFGCG